MMESNRLNFHLKVEVPFICVSIWISAVLEPLSDKNNMETMSIRNDAPMLIMQISYLEVNEDDR